MFPSLQTLFRCCLVTLIVALPPTAGCRTPGKSETIVAAGDPPMAKTAA